MLLKAGDTRCTHFNMSIYEAKQKRKRKKLKISHIWKKYLLKS